MSIATKRARSTALREPADVSAMHDTLLGQFNAHFQSVPANTPERMKMAHGIRRQVGCLEGAHENSPHRGGGETDAFDSHAVHNVLLHRPTTAALGAARLILPRNDAPERSFCIQRVMGTAASREFDKLPLQTTAEISPLFISGQIRQLSAAAGNPEQAAFLNNCGPLVRLGLLQGLLRLSERHRITHWCALLEPVLLRILGAMGIRFQPIGPPVEFHGPRQPCHCTISDMLANAHGERPAFWSVITDGGSLAANAACLSAA